MRDEGPLALQPVQDAKALQTLGNELDATVAAHGLMHADDRADTIPIGRARHLVLVRPGQDQADELMGRLADALDGLEPRVLAQDHGHGLRRKERAGLERQQQQLGRQGVAEPRRDSRPRLVAGVDGNLRVSILFHCNVALHAGLA